MCLNLILLQKTDILNLKRGNLQFDSVRIF